MLAAVNGPAAGIGCSLALACDLIVAAESAFFLLAFVNIGLVPDGGVTATVPARAGAARAAEMAMLGERVRRRDGARVGADQPGRRPTPTSTRRPALLLAHLAAGPTRAYANIKALLNRTPLRATSPRSSTPRPRPRASRAGPRDFVEGVLAFAEKRPPRFTGT